MNAPAHPFIPEHEQERLAREEPERLAEVLPGLPIHCLTFAAEILGRDGPPEVSIPALEALLTHGNALAREGALLGLEYAHRRHSAGLPSQLRFFIEAMSVEDPSPGVRATAVCVADTWSEGGGA